jgi:hypothetical protein
MHLLGRRNPVIRCKPFGLAGPSGYFKPVSRARLFHDLANTPPAGADNDRWSPTHTGDGRAAILPLDRGRCLPVNNGGPKYASRRSWNSRLGSVAVTAASAGAAHLTTFRQRLDLIANEPAATLCSFRMFPSSRGFSRPNPQTAAIPKSFRYSLARPMRRLAPSRPSCG